MGIFSNRVFTVLLGIVTILFYQNCSELTAKQREQLQANLNSENFNTGELIFGKSLYDSNCASCHGPGDISTKQDRSFNQISLAIANVPQMNNLAYLTNDQINEISLYLSGDSELTPEPMPPEEEPAPQPMPEPMPPEEEPAPPPMPEPMPPEEEPAPQPMPEPMPPEEEPAPQPMPEPMPPEEEPAPQPMPEPMPPEEEPAPPMPEPPAGIDCSDPKILLCEDFESGSIDSRKWNKVESKGGIVDVQTQRARSGRFALRSRLKDINGTSAMIQNKSIFPVSRNRFFGRAWLYMTSVSSGHTLWLRGIGKLRNGDVASYGLDAWNGRYDGRYRSPAADRQQHGGLRDNGENGAVGRWQCIEWEFNGDGNQMRFWIDGSETPDMEGRNWDGPRFEEFRIGLHHYHPDPNPVAYWDDIVLATERVGCGD